MPKRGVRHRTKTAETSPSSPALRSSGQTIRAEKTTVATLVARLYRSVAPGVRGGGVARRISKLRMRRRWCDLSPRSRWKSCRRPPPPRRLHPQYAHLPRGQSRLHFPSKQLVPRSRPMRVSPVCNDRLPAPPPTLECWPEHQRLGSLAAVRRSRAHQDRHAARNQSRAAWDMGSALSAAQRVTPAASQLRQSEACRISGSFAAVPAMAATLSGEMLQSDGKQSDARHMARLETPGRRGRVSSAKGMTHGRALGLTCRKLVWWRASVGTCAAVGGASWGTAAADGSLPMSGRLHVRRRRSAYMYVCMFTQCQRCHLPSPLSLSMMRLHTWTRR